ncbi:MAG: MFS transporter [Actinobacteria bacterium]|nr:MFS transporter [Cyanobacteriota bacterium]MCL6086932.1 MFS transporter [Actinomycetota bacterium]
MITKEIFKKKNTFGISKNVFAMGWVSFFNDIASEMVYPIVPIFLTTFLGASVAIVGVIEGIAESTAALLKVFSGWLSDKFQKRMPFVVSGYSLSAVSKLLLGLSYTWPLVLIARFFDRFGKGIRTSARDSLITESCSANERGKSFGFHRALDTLGAVFGPLAAILFLTIFKNNLRLTFYIAFIPALIGIILLLVFVKEKKKKALCTSDLKLRWRDVNPSFKIYLFINIIFFIGNSSDTFLILRAQNLGLAIKTTIFAYVLFNITYSLFSIPAGIIVDKIGAKKVIITGLFIFSIVYFFFGFINSSIFIWILFPIYGIHMALTEGVGKAYISLLVPIEKSGTAFGIYQTAIGICSFFASFIAGLMWSYINVRVPFYFGSIMAFISAILFIGLGRKVKTIK